LEKQLEQLRASIAQAEQTQPDSPEVTDGPAQLNKSLIQNTEAISTGNQIPVPPDMSGISWNPRSEEPSRLPPILGEPPSADDRREPLRPISASPVFTPATSDRTLDLITVKQQQIDELFSM
jgi:hypothetical protein